LLIHGARSTLIYAPKKEDSRSFWMTRLKERSGMNRTAVAVANKNARIAMAMILSGERYRKAS
jgi:transposase